MIMRRLRDVRNHTLAVAALLMVSACGPVGDAEPVVSSTPAAELGWTAQVLDAVSGVDVPLQVTAEGDQAVVLVVADDGRVSGFATGRDGRFRPGTPVETGIAYLYLAEPVRSADEWLAAGSGALDSADSEAYEVRVLRSADGRSWSQADVTGFDRAADVSALAAVDRRRRRGRHVSDRRRPG